ncbi:DUF4365 domain-containing protein [Mesorhizobium sp. WSM4303]|uniref:DUF4365 domain-containing protein n=1 Tax=unclassified Mesorhizobium TaxID=325217 RepID=UPI00115C8AE5|nr:MULTISPECIES: DUF4365 domain-containing protein [unclassified Mesorhizobium]TRC92516.1 DUF4365 domain-containing protein [Mesorhizobium sp. WSM4306]TRD03496.1 DUF4365 domain-containing protein [Mesorhizobium sp. WSM4303]
MCSLNESISRDNTPYGGAIVRLVKNHRLASRAVLAVCSVLDRAGALSEAIKNDYGEDLLVQTHLRDEADNFHVLIQVKGTAKITGKGDLKTFRFDVSHLQRWVGFIQPVLICLYEESTGLIYALRPGDHFSLWELSTTKNKTLLAKFTDTSIFDENSATSFIWRSRIEYYSKFLSYFENNIRYNFNNFPPGKINGIQAEMNIVVISFLKTLGLLKKDIFDDDFRAKIRNASTNLSASNSDPATEKVSLRHVFMLCLLGRTHDVCGQGLPTNLMEYGTEMCGLFFRQFHKDEWNEAKKKFPGERWAPYNVNQRTSRKHAESR